MGVVTHISQVTDQAQSFLKAMSVAGTLYMLAFPVLWFISSIVPAYMRNRVIVFGNLIVQLFAIIIMLNQMAKKGTKFQELSKSSRDLLPKKR